METGAVDPKVEETLETPEPLTPEQIADLQKKANAYEDQKKRAEIAEAELKKRPKASEPTTPTPVNPTVPSTSDDNVTRARLEARGILDEDEQDAVIEAARVLNTTPIKALDNEIVKGRLAAIKAQKATTTATPAPSRGGGTTTNIGRLADKALETGEMPSDPKLKAQVKEELRKRSK
jgi:hypothetical protein